MSHMPSIQPPADLLRGRDVPTDPGAAPQTGVPARAQPFAQQWAAELRQASGTTAAPRTGTGAGIRTAQLPGFPDPARPIRDAVVDAATRKAREVMDRLGMPDKIGEVSRPLLREVMRQTLADTDVNSAAELRAIQDARRLAAAMVGYKVPASGSPLVRNGDPSRTGARLDALAGLQDAFRGALFTKYLAEGASRAVFEKYGMILKDGRLPLPPPVNSVPVPPALRAGATLVDPRKVNAVYQEAFDAAGDVARNELAWEQGEGLRGLAYQTGIPLAREHPATTTVNLAQRVLDAFASGRVLVEVHSVGGAVSTMNQTRDHIFPAQSIEQMRRNINNAHFPSHELD